MPVSKETFESLYPCEFFTPEELFEEDQMYTVPEIARRLQGLPPDAEIDAETESVLIDWAIPWIFHVSDELVVGEPLEEDGSGYYGMRST